MEYDLRKKKIKGFFFVMLREEWKRKPVWENKQILFDKFCMCLTKSQTLFNALDVEFFLFGVEDFRKKMQVKMVLCS